MGTQISDTAPNSKSSNWLSTLYQRIFKRALKSPGTQGNTQLQSPATPILGSIANPIILSNGYYEIEAYFKQAREENSNMVKNAIGIPVTNTQPTTNEGGDPSISLSARQAAVSMRERAMECVTIPGLGMRPEDIITHIKNAIAQLPDFE